MLYDKKWDKEVKVDKVGQVLLKAADYIEKHGWCQKEAFSPDGRACMLGGIYAACGGEFREAGLIDTPPNYDKAVERIVKFAPELGGWNDQPHRTKNEVVAVLRKAAYAE
jgi:hypothetical protein